MRNSTIIPKKKACVTCGELDYIFSKGRCKQCAVIGSTQRRLEAAESVELGESIANLTQDLDAIFSRYIRLLGSDAHGIASCFTCPTKNHYTQMQCGHFIPRANMGTRWLVENCKVQCPTCNEVKNGNLEEYAENLGSVQVAYLKEAAREVTKFSREDLKGMIAEYRFKVKYLEKKLETVGK